MDENADIRIIVSSIQIIAEGHGFEKWGNLPKEKERLYNLIDSKNIKDIIFLSGDSHAGAIYKDKTTKGTKLYEITSSSLNLQVLHGLQNIKVKIDHLNQGLIELTPCIYGKIMDSLNLLKIISIYP